MTHSETSAELHTKAQNFADELTKAFRGIRKDAPEFSARLRQGPQVLIGVLDEQLKSQPIYLPINGNDQVGVDVEFHGCWDASGKFLAVEKSRVAVMLKERKPEPIVRFEFERSWGGSGPPSAHLHVHAHRDEALHLLRLSSRGRPSSQDRQGKVPRLAEIHFPLGGHRYRPCLEEILWFVVYEFGVEAEPGWEEILEEGIRRWREIQLLAAVRDNPEVAVRALADMNYGVEPPEAGHPRPSRHLTIR